ncbi:MAG: DNA polymerase ligase N-terminal domain-containing protein [Acidimicrobiales bacterium]
MPSLAEYRRKRDFSVTPEPEPEPNDAPSAPETAGTGKPRFVVQEHHARRLHWDFRLEHDGVLVPWAVPKGLPPDPRVNHLAVHTEDHPLSYFDFEGEIPKGNYGAGVVELWDQGTYHLEKWRPGEIIVVLHGRQVQGRYILFQTNEDHWMVHRMDPPQDPTREPMPYRIEPMWPVEGELPPPAHDGDYGYEIAWNGLRTVVFGEGGSVRVQDESSTSRWPELVRLGRALGSHEAILDGELVALGEDGQPHRERLDRRLAGAAPESVPLTYMVYDLLYLDGHPLLDEPYTERRNALAALELSGFHWQAPAHHVGDGAALLDLARQRGLAGIVAKRLDSPYRPGQQSPDWIGVASG